MNRSWPALIVDRVQEEHLRWNSQGRIETENLPVELVHVTSTTDVSKIAVLSWRWDTDPGRPSRNILCAVRYAKSNRLRHLFIDTVSINQALPKSELIQEVVAFSRLFRTIPILVAYDNAIDKTFRLTTRRPWIFSEMQSFKYNPYPITYLGHMQYQGTYQLWGFKSSFMRVTMTFSDFFEVVLSVLFDEIKMADCADFQFIIPALGDVFRAAFEQMTEKDYLFTVAIFCSTHLSKKSWRPFIKLHNPQLERYLIQKRGGELRWRYDIFFDRIQIAEWKVDGQVLHRQDLRVFQHAERIVLAALNFSNEYFRNWSSERKSRVRSLEDDFLSRSSAAVPLCRTIQMDLDSE